jgi:hypothetical protein
VLDAMRDFVGQRLGAKYIEPPQFDLEGSFAESDPTTPIIFILPPGSDPTGARVFGLVTIFHCHLVKLWIVYRVICGRFTEPFVGGLHTLSC